MPKHLNTRQDKAAGDLTVFYLPLTDGERINERIKLAHITRAASDMEARAAL